MPQTCPYKARMLPISPRHYVCYRALTPVVLDGKLDKEPWRKSPWCEPFVDIEGEHRPSPTLSTLAKMLWDDEFLYVGAELEEPHVRAVFTERGSPIFRESDFEVFVDPDSDGIDYVEIEINAHNAVWDLLMSRPYREGGRPRSGWQIQGLRTAVHVKGTLNEPSDTDQGWSVEMALPWSDLADITFGSLPPAEGDIWRVNFLRIQRPVRVVSGKYHPLPDRPVEYWAWSPPGVVDMHRPDLWGYVRFSNRTGSPDDL